MLSVLYFSLGFGPEHDLVTTGLGFEAKNHDLGLGLGLVDVACEGLGLMHLQPG